MRRWSYATSRAMNRSLPTELNKPGKMVQVALVKPPPQGLDSLQPPQVLVSPLVLDSRQRQVRLHTHCVLHSLQILAHRYYWTLMLRAIRFVRAVFLYVSYQSHLLPRKLQSVLQVVRMPSFCWKGLRRHR
jgi:hypothetical protein